MKAQYHPPLKRHESLQPFSRDHFIGLKAANRLVDAAADAPEARAAAAKYFYDCWNAEMAEHFTQEEQLLIALMLPPEIAQLRHEHHEIRTLAKTGGSESAGQPPSGPWCKALGQKLHDHIRWEERVLFGAIQRRATPEQLTTLAEATAEIEKHRPGLRIRRGRKSPGGRLKIT
ncbi:MAG: hemerythrin domain-containing protein [Phycisphaerales bacterium]|nr:hemerythrin domain-containing protein [Phycisphaerales bacterium]